MSQDACPAWADNLIKQLEAMEIALGNIRPSGKDWSENDLEAVYNRAFANSDRDDRADEEAVEALFTKIAKDLAKEGFDAPAIAAMVNARVGAGGKLPYCDASEVRSALD